jgi:hypothetical protein
VEVWVNPTQTGIDRTAAGGYATELTGDRISGDENHLGVLPINPRTHHAIR